MARKTHTLTLSDGEPRQVRFTWATLDRIRDRAGIELEDFRDKQRMAQVVTRHLPLFIWAALIKQERERLPLDDIGDLIDFDDLPRISGELMAAMGGGPENPIEAAATVAAVNGSPSTGAEQWPELNSASASANSGG
jgi:hypothetical protein